MASLEGSPGSDTDKPPPERTGPVPLAAKKESTSAEVPSRESQPKASPWSAEELRGFDPEHQPKTEAWKRKKELEIDQYNAETDVVHAYGAGVRGEP